MNKPSKSSERFARAILAGLVIAATGCAAVLALSAEIPNQLPGVALGSPALYREELGVAHLIGFYFAILLIALAAYGRGLVKFGKDGAEAGDVIGRKVEAQSDAAEKFAVALKEQEHVGRGNATAIEAIRQAFGEKAREDKRQIKEMASAIQALQEKERDCERRIAALEKG